MGRESRLLSLEDQLFQQRYEKIRQIEALGFEAYPRKYAREIYNNESIVMGPRQANKLVNSCSLCGLCERVCPEDFAVQDLCLQARRSMVRSQAGRCTAGR